MFVLHFPMGILSVMTSFDYDFDSCRLSSTSTAVIKVPAFNDVSNIILS